MNDREDELSDVVESIHLTNAEGERIEVGPPEIGWRPDDAEPGYATGGLVAVDRATGDVRAGVEHVMPDGSAFFEEFIQVDKSGLTILDAVDGKSRFVIDDDSKASWAFRKIAAHRAEINRCRALAAEERQRIADWEADACGPVERRIERLEAMLAGYAATLIDEDPKRRKWSTPGGDIVQRKAPDKVVVNDEEAFVEWSLAYCPDAVKTSPLVSKVGRDRFSMPGLTLDAKGKPAVEGQRSKVTFTPDTTTGEGPEVPGIEYVVGESRLSLVPAEASAVEVERPEWDALVEDDDG